MIPHSKPCLGIEEREAVEEVIQSAQIAQNQRVEALETDLAEFLGCRGAVVISSGSAALHLALLAMGADSKTTVHIPSYVCTALLNAAGYCRAKISICDVDSNSGNLDPDSLFSRLEGKDEILILPHMFGAPAEIKPIISAGIRTIEDCAQSIGADIEGNLMGNFTEAAIFSFYATKVLCAGEGGAVASNSEEILKIVKDLRDYDNKPDYRLRFNYKMTDIQAALGRIQLKKLPGFIERRREIARQYNEIVESTRFSAPQRPEGDIYFRYIFFCSDVPGTIARLRAEGITAAKPVFKPLHRYLNLDGFPNTEKIYNSAVSIPCYPALSDEDVEHVCTALLKVGSTCSAAH